MLNFNVETHGDIRFCTICRRYIVMKANSPQQAPTPRSRLQPHGLSPPAGLGRPPGGGWLSTVIYSSVTRQGSWPVVIYGYLQPRHALPRSERTAAGSVTLTRVLLSMSHHSPCIGKAPGCLSATLHTIFQGFWPF